MKKRTYVMAAVALLAVMLAGPASAWERGTHAFIADVLKAAFGPANIEEMYGAMAPDAFNYMFTMPSVLYRDYLYDQTHHYFVKVRNAVRWGYEKPSAYGFISHNNTWGADSTAHHNSLTLNPNEGYVITKAKMLHGWLMANVPEYAALLGPYPQVALEVCHNIIEAAGDIVLVRHDKKLGQKIVRIALQPKINMQNLMVRAYARGLAEFSATTIFPLTLAQAEQLIRTEESKFRLSCIAYGFLLQQSESVILENVIEQFKQLAYAYLSQFGIPVPPDPQLTALLQVAFTVSINLIKDDYFKEVMATIGLVKRNMVKEIK